MKPEKKWIPSMETKIGKCSIDKPKLRKPSLKGKQRTQAN